MEQAILDKNTPWTNIGIKVCLDKFLTRKVLVEKSSLEKSKRIEMKEFFISKIDGCELFTNSEHPDYIFYIKETEGNKEILMEKLEKNKTFYIKHSNLWSVFESKYGLDYYEIQSFTQATIEESLKSTDYKTHYDFLGAPDGLEELLKSQGYKTNRNNLIHYKTLEKLIT